MVSIIDSIEKTAASAYSAVKNAVLQIGESVEKKIAEVRRLRTQFSALYATLKTTDQILNETAGKITYFGGRSASKGRREYAALVETQTRLAKNQTTLNQYINAAVKKYGNILVGTENESLSDLGVLPVIAIGGISISAIAALAALLAYIAKLVAQHKADVAKQQAQVATYEKLLSALETGQIDTNQFSSLWTSTAETASLSSKDIMPLLVVGGIIVAGLIFLNRTL